MSSHENREEFPPDVEELFQANQLELLLYRQCPDRTLQYLTTFTPEAFGPKQIRKRYGGGRFQVIAKRGGEIVRRRAIQIEGPPIIRGAGRNSETYSGYALGSLIDKLPVELRAMRKRLEALEERQEALHRLLNSLTSRDPRYRLSMQARRRP
ncbi:MAG: hypothetical protein ACRD2L_09105 [Terriglobia bacterium]